MPNTSKAGCFNDVALIFLLVPHPMNNTFSIEKQSRTFKVQIEELGIQEDGIGLNVIFFE